MKALNIIAYVLVYIGALNWGLVGVGGFVGGNWNVVNLILGSIPTLEWIVYLLVGLSALWLLLFRNQGESAVATMNPQSV